MTQTAIIYPGIAMFFLTLGVLVRLGIARYTAVRDRSVSLKFFRTYNEGTQPDRLHLLSRHVQNHFEVPPIFYAAILFTYASDSVTVLSVACAWLFVLARCIHTYIHLGSNNVLARFRTFIASLVFLTAIWVSLLFTLLRSGV